MLIQQTEFTDLPPKLENPYLDSSVFLAHIKEEATKCIGGSTRFQITTNIFEDARKKKYQLYTSTVTLAEVRRLKDSRKELTDDEIEKVNRHFQDFTEHEWLFLIEVNREIGERAQQLGAQYGIWPMDAIHIASAIYWDCGVFMVWDKGSLTTKLPRKIDNLYICEPYWEGITPMPSQ